MCFPASPSLCFPEVSPIRVSCAHRFSSVYVAPVLLSLYISLCPLSLSLYGFSLLCSLSLSLSFFFSFSISLAVFCFLFGRCLCLYPRPTYICFPCVTDLIWILSCYFSLLCCPQYLLLCCFLLHVLLDPRYLCFISVCIYHRFWSSLSLSLSLSPISLSLSLSVTSLSLSLCFSIVSRSYLSNYMCIYIHIYIVCIYLSHFFFVLLSLSLSLHIYLLWGFLLPVFC